MKPRIREIIVVEGKNDTNTLQTYFACDTIETGGDQINPVTLERISMAQQKRGVIVFTDPDHPGEHIRRQIQEAVPGCKHAFIDKKKARTERKVGVEHACKEDLWESLNHLVTFEKGNESLSWADFVDLGLAGGEDARKRREEICARFHIGPCNAKTCFKRLNQMNITLDDLKG